MVRRYEELIEVRAGAGVGPGLIDRVCDIDRDDRAPDRTPSAFLWRGRLYIVRAVIGHWRERRAWWREALDPVEDGSDTRDRPAAYGRPGCLEQEVWRVEASPGRLAGTGVYDLGMNGATGATGATGVSDQGMNGQVRGWRLLRVAD